MFQFFLKKLKNRVMFRLLSAYNDYVEIQRIERSRKTDVFYDKRRQHYDWLLSSFRLSFPYLPWNDVIVIAPKGAPWAGKAPNGCTCKTKATSNRSWLFPYKSKFFQKKRKKSKELTIINVLAGSSEYIENGGSSPSGVHLGFGSVKR